MRFFPGAISPRPLRLARVGSAAWPACGLATVGAYLVAMALRDSRFAAVAWIGLLPIFLGLRLLRPWAAAAVAGVWGAGVFLFSSGSAALADARTGIGFLLVTTLPALYAFVGARMIRRVGFHPLLLALAWMGVEFALQPLGLRYGLLAGIQGRNLLFEVIGGALGYLFVAFLLALANMLVLLLLEEIPAAVDRPPWSPGPRAPQALPLADPCAAIRLRYLLTDRLRPRAPPVSPRPALT